MRRVITCLCIPLVLVFGITNNIPLYAKTEAASSATNNEVCYYIDDTSCSPPGCQTPSSNCCSNCGYDCCREDCGDYCPSCGYYFCQTGGPYKWSDNPCAALCGTRCGVSYYTMALGAALIVGIAAIILSTGTAFHGHSTCF